jgi:hypothetical protein
MLFTGLPGAGAIVYGVYTLNSNNFAYTEQVLGTVKRIHVNNSFRRRSDVEIEVEYSVNGQNFSRSFDTSKSYSTGNQVTVYYQKDHPENSSLSSEESNKLGAIIAIVIGIILLFVTYALYRSKSDDSFMDILLLSSIW